MPTPSGGVIIGYQVQVLTLNSSNMNAMAKQLKTQLLNASFQMQQQSNGKTPHCDVSLSLPLA